MRYFTTHKASYGFTIVELLIVISVISILAGITIVSYGGWRERTAQGEVASDLNSVAAAMENARNFSTGYPAAIPTNFTASANVTVTLKAQTATTYCAEAQSKVVTTVIYHVSDANKTPTAGIC